MQKTSSVMLFTPVFTWLLVLMGSAQAAVPENYDSAVSDLQQRWAVANYELKDQAQKSAFEKLATDADALTAAHPKRAEVWIWSGIIKSTYAGVKGGLGALKLAKASRKDLEQALAIDPNAMNGSAYTSLGTLYFKVPGWPLGFGDNDKAAELLQKALAINPTGIDPNYFYGEFLYKEKGDEAGAKTHLLRAQQAPPRASRPLADKGRQQEIRELLTEIDG